MSGALTRAISSKKKRVASFVCGSKTVFVEKSDVVGRERRAVRPRRVAPQVIGNRLAVSADAAVALGRNGGRQLWDWAIVRAAAEQPRHRQGRDPPDPGVEMRVQAAVFGRLSEAERVRNRIRVAPRPRAGLDVNARARAGAN